MIHARTVGGITELIPTNILHSHEELNAEGDLKCTDTFSKRGSLGFEHRLTLEESENIEHDEIDSIPLKMYIKQNGRYAFHPDLDLEIPIHLSCLVDKTDVWKNCEINVRRDNRDGLLRYYVVKIND